MFKKFFKLSATSAVFVMFSLVFPCVVTEVQAKEPISSAQLEAEQNQIADLKAKIAEANTKETAQKFDITQNKIKSFEAAKRHLPNIYHQLTDKFSVVNTIYCACPIDFTKQGKNYRWGKIDLEACNYTIRNKKNQQRAKRIEAEHIVPAYNFGRSLKCWKDGGRKNCDKDRTFKIMEGDLHNLYPAIGEVNGDRSNFAFSQWVEKNPSPYGESCNMYVDTKNKQVMPPENARGIIARTYFYMAERYGQYGFSLSKQDQRLFTAWDKTYTVTPFECERNRLIGKVMGHENRFVTEKCEIAKL